MKLIGTAPVRAVAVDRGLGGFRVEGVGGDPYLGLDGDKVLGGLNGGG